MLPPDWQAMGEAAKLFTRSLMMGLDSAVRKAEFDEPSAEDIENMPYHEAVEYLKKRDVIKKVDYDSLSDKMRFRAFTASRIADGDLLKKLNAEMIASVNDGKGLSDFLSLTKTDILDKIGMGAGSGWYYETVYRTNVQTAYNVGRAMGFAEDKPLALELVIIDDSRTSDICRQYAGKRFILPYDHPFWQTHWPPFHFNCRTTIRAIYDESELPENWSNPKDIEDANNGFGVYPLSNDSWWEELSSQVARAKEYGLQGEILGAKTVLSIEKHETKSETTSETISAQPAPKTIEEWENRIREEDWFTHGTINGVPWRSDEELTLYGMDVRGAKEVHDAFEKIFDMYPEFKNKFSAPNAYLMKKGTYADTQWMKTGDSAISFNVSDFKDWTKLERKYADDAAKLFHPVGTTANSIIYHEIGHSIDCYMTEILEATHGKKYFSSFVKQKALQRLKIKSGDDTIKASLSGYATKDAMEFFAEAIGEFFGSKNPRPVAAEVGKILTEELKALGRL